MLGSRFFFNNMNSGLIEMTKAGAAPCLAQCMPEFAPKELEVDACPPELGLSPKCVQCLLVIHVYNCNLCT